LLRGGRQASPSSPGPAIEAVSPDPTCDRCGKTLQFDGPDSASVVVTFSTPPTTRSLCAACTSDEAKERQWRETGIWVGSDLPPSLRGMRPASPEELRRLLGDDE
jgi:hypothetical protein